MSATIPAPLRPFPPSAILVWLVVDAQGPLSVTEIAVELDRKYDSFDVTFREEDQHGDAIEAGQVEFLYMLPHIPRAKADRRADIDGGEAELTVNEGGARVESTADGYKPTEAVLGVHEDMTVSITLDARDDGTEGDGDSDEAAGIE